MAYKRMGAILALLSMMLATGAHGLIFGAGTGELNGCTQDIFNSVNTVRAAKGAPAIEHLGRLAQSAQFKADNLASDGCNVYDNGGYLHYACHGEGCSNTCSNAASLWLSGVKFGGPENLDDTREGRDQFSYELLTSAEVSKMGCATAAGWSDKVNAPCSVTVCYTGSNLIKTVAKAEGKPDVSFWLAEASWDMPSTKVKGDHSDECPSLALHGLCGAGYRYINNNWKGIVSDGFMLSVDETCRGSCAPVVNAARRRALESGSMRRMLRA